ncbi:UNVERIFIED_CONTAM: hypothetical protein PYX00_006886 [Menopon gallinae]|uniref:Transmembrane protein 18 n=1 Tax=Menopon gallinae TaxID=328185 RepID=A0AAW2HYI9_9NEOP
MRGKNKQIQFKMADYGDFRIDEVDGLVTFLRNIEWQDPWIVGLIIFHITVTLTTVLTRNHGNFQVALFLILLLLVYFSESINELASNYWTMFSRQQYFDSKGMFISLVFSAPILLNCMVLVASWLYQSSQLMTKLKRAQLEAQYTKQKSQRAEKRTIPGPDGKVINRMKHKSEKCEGKVSESKSIDATGIECRT